MNLNTQEYYDCSYYHKRGIPKSELIYNEAETLTLDEYINHCQPFDVVFIEGYHTKSRVVQYLTNSPFSHVGIFLGDNIHKSYAEIIPYKGFEIGSINKYIDYNGKVYIGRVQTIISDGIKLDEKIINKYKNCKYENFLVYKVMEKFFFRKTTKYSKERYICSELVQDVFDLLGCKYNSREGDFVYPSDIEKSETIRIIYKLDL